MAGEVPRRAWLLMAAGDNRGHGGNAGYDDQADAYYSWDSNVPNHRNLRVGDPIALWDKERLLGASVIEEIETSRGSKVLRRCPHCTTTRISERKRAQPRYRCMKCRNAFEDPVIDIVEVDLYRARYDAAWTPLDGLLEEYELRSLAVHAGDQNAMRPLDWTAFGDALASKGAGRTIHRVAARLDISWAPTPGLEVALPHGFRQEVVRVRKGQRQFRHHLLDAQGSICAFTGSAPEQVLDAGHLYSYAQLGTHFAHAGLMPRRDLHRLFDDGLLAVHPPRLRVDVAADLAKYPQYSRLHDGELTLRLREEHVEWLDKHWREHRL